LNEKLEKVQEEILEKEGDFNEKEQTWEAER